MRLVVVLSTSLLVGFQLFAEPAAPVQGDYYEIRSNHIYTCGCLYSGELVTGGTEAIVAWNLHGGGQPELSFENVRIGAVILGAGSLSLGESPRMSVVYLDGISAAGQEQQLVSWLKNEYGALLGRILSIRHAAISIHEEDGVASLRIGDAVAARMRDARLPEDAHLGSQQWFDPFVPLKVQQLSSVLLDEYQGEDLGTRWRRERHRIAEFRGEFSH